LDTTWFSTSALCRITPARAAIPRCTGLCRFGLCACGKIENEIKGEFQPCGYHPNIKIKKLNTGKHRIKCGTKYVSVDKRGKPKYDDMCLEFMDTRQLAGALLGAGCNKSLKSLCRMLGTEHQKKYSKGHAKIIDET
jgi:hypothetical protein